MEKENIVYMTLSNYRRIVAVHVSNEEIIRYLNEYINKVGDRAEVEKKVKEKYGGKLDDREVKSLLIQNLIAYLVDEIFKNKIGFLNMGDMRGMAYVYKLLRNEFGKDGIDLLKKATMEEDTYTFVSERTGYPVYHLFEDCEALESRKIPMIFIPKEVKKDANVYAGKYVEEQCLNESEEEKENCRKTRIKEKLEEYRKWWLEKDINGKSLKEQLEEEVKENGDVSVNLRDEIKKRHVQKWHCDFDMAVLSVGGKVSIINDRLKKLAGKVDAELLKYDELCEHYPVLIEREKALYKEIEKIEKKQETQGKEIELSPQEKAFLQADEIRKTVVAWLKQYMQIKLNPDLEFDEELLEALNCRCCKYCENRRSEELFLKMRDKTDFFPEICATPQYASAGKSDPGEG